MATAGIVHPKMEFLKSDALLLLVLVQLLQQQQQQQQQPLKLDLSVC
jgi:hypothetical protein